MADGSNAVSGVQFWSLPIKAGSYYIFASFGYSPDYVDEWLQAEGIGHKRLQGSWDGQPEDSWIVHSNDWSRVAWLAEGENAVLRLDDRQADGTRLAYVYNLATLKAQFIGWWTDVGKQYATKQQAWTHDPMTGAYFCVRDTQPVPYVPKQPRITPGKYDLNAKYLTGCHAPAP